MRNRNCHDSFERGHHERALRPLPSGAYRLEQLRGWLHRDYRELQCIEDYRCGRVSRWNLQCCTPEDMHVWLKDLPPSVAYSLGYDLLPATLALTENGVDARSIQTLLPQLRYDVQRLVDDLEQARAPFAHQISHEYRLMSAGESSLAPLVQRGILLINTSLQLVPSKSPAHSCPVGEVLGE